jgi:hypothetical protein
MAHITKLGAMVRGGMFIGTLYWHIYIVDEGELDRSFVAGTLVRAMDVEGVRGLIKNIPEA